MDDQGTEDIQEQSFFCTLPMTKNSKELFLPTLNGIADSILYVFLHQLLYMLGWTISQDTCKDRRATIEYSDAFSEVKHRYKNSVSMHALTSLLL